MANSILPNDLPKALDAFPDAEILSLDCFDTLLWRNANAPKDVFADLKPGGINAHQRMLAERRARVMARINERRNEVTIDEIYAALLPNAAESDRLVGIERELAAEARHCFPFAPTVALMKAAKARGMRVIIVSDTYLTQEQLTELLRRAAGEDVLALIDHIFCSSAYSKPKAGGLFRHVLAELKVASQQLLHIGDNRTADFEAPTALGIPAIHLAQFDQRSRERLRLEVAAGTIFDPRMRTDLPAYQPHRAALAIAQPQLADPVFALGYAGLGPVFHGFANWLRHEAAELEEQTGRRVRLMFLMRDGHLPKLVFEALGDSGFATCSGEISRFTSTAATFTDEQTILTYVRSAAAQGHSIRYVLGCLLFPPEEIQRIGAKMSAGQRGREALLRYISKPQTLRTIIHRSKAFQQRMLRHVAERAAIEEGETLMLVDLGYNGTVQNNVAGVLEKGLGVHVAGRYLLLREAELTGLDKRGYVDTRLYDERALHALSTSVAVLEQLATVTQGSVVDYEPSGAPIRKRNTITEEQTRIREAVQEACVQFTRDCASASHRRPASDDVAWDYGGAACMARLLFLPTSDELEVLSRFEHDINLGTNALVQLFDADGAARDLKRNGLFYLKQTRRMYLPGELRPQGLSLSLAALTSWRLSLDLERSDFDGRGIELPILVAGGDGVSQDVVRATPTHDGYFVASVPVGAGKYAIGFQFARLYEWLQIESAWLVPTKTLIGARGPRPEDLTEVAYLLEGFEEAAPGLLRATEENGFVMVPPAQSDQPLILNLAFRPIQLRQTSNVHVLDATSAQPRAEAA